MKRRHRVLGLKREASRFRGLQAARIGGVHGDLMDRSSLAPLLRGADGFFIVTTPFGPDFSVNPEKEIRQATSAIDAARSAAIPHVVFTSVASSDEYTGIPHFESKAKVEQYLRASRLSYTITRPVAFMDN